MAEMSYLVKDAKYCEIEAFTEKLSPKRFLVDIEKERVVVRRFGSSIIKFIYNTPDLEMFCNANSGEGPQHGGMAGKPVSPGSNGPPKTSLSSAPAIRSEVADLKDEVARLNALILELRAKGKRVVADRDHWQSRAKSVESEIEILRNQRPASTPDDRFAQAKRAFAKLYHPNNANASGMEKIVRAEVFKEFWNELERIERGE